MARFPSVRIPSTRARLLASAVLLGLAVPAAAPAVAGDLTITVTGVRSASGNVRVALFDQEAAFPDSEKARTPLQVRAAEGAVKLTVKDLPPGRYALAAFHDENANGKLDRNFIGIPKEGYGFSNDARGMAGPPKFAAAAFTVGAANQAVSLVLDY
jgi:uncharacterized protein (DUF2141 family)